MTAETEQQQAASLPEPQITAALTFSQWCTVLGYVTNAPYREVAPLIERLMTQIAPQVEAQQLQAALAVAPTASEARN